VVRPPRCAVHVPRNGGKVHADLAAASADALTAVLPRGHDLRATFDAPKPILSVSSTGVHQILLTCPGNTRYVFALVHQQVYLLVLYPVHVVIFGSPA
jgi:hypothetical protein